MKLTDIAGQEDAKAHFLNMYQNGRLPHALMLAGPDGYGGLPLALAMAQYVFCEGPKETDSCGVCAACSKVARMEHADLHFSFPSFRERSDKPAVSAPFLQSFREFVAQTPYGSDFDWLQHIHAENKQGNISAEECRVMIEKLMLKSYEGGWKVQIIWRPEYLGKEGNILLKLIEEPPAKTLLLLVAEDPDQILSTIRSRVQTLRLKPMPQQHLARELERRKAVSTSEIATQIAALAGGSLGQALELAREQSGADMLQDVRKWFTAIFQKDTVALSRFAEDWSKTGREHQKAFLDFTSAALGYGLQASFSPALLASLPSAYRDFAARLADKKFAPQVFQRMSSLLSEVRYRIERNCNPKLQMHGLSIRLGMAMSGKADPVSGMPTMVA